VLSQQNLLFSVRVETVLVCFQHHTYYLGISLVNPSKILEKLFSPVSSYGRRSSPTTRDAHFRFAHSIGASACGGRGFPPPSP
jgi:hypothetical protein